jgi:hypothetical protein
VIRIRNIDRDHILAEIKRTAADNGGVPIGAREMDESKRLELIAEAIRYCQRVRQLGMPPSCYTKALREPTFFLWECRRERDKDRVARFRSTSSLGVQRGRGALRYDHAVPFRYLQDELLNLQNLAGKAVRAILDSYGIAVLITAEDEDGWTGQACGTGCLRVGTERIPSRATRPSESNWSKTACRHPVRDCIRPLTTQLRTIETQDTRTVKVRSSAKSSSSWIAHGNRSNGATVNWRHVGEPAPWTRLPGFERY